MSVRRRAEELHDEIAGWNRVDAMELVRRTYAKINADRERNGLPGLHEADLTSAMRANAVRFVLGGPPDVDTFATAAAQCIAALVWLLRAEEMDITAGDDAA